MTSGRLKGKTLIGIRRVGWVVLVAMLSACRADAPQSPADSSLSDAGSITAAPANAHTASGDPATEDAQPGADVLTADGWGPLRIGMTAAEITAALGPDANPDAVGGPDPDRCDEFRPQNAPEGVLVMVQRGVLTRISVSRNENIRTSERLRIGDPESKVLAAHGMGARIEPHQYWPSPAKYITVWREPRSEENARGLRYEIDAAGRIAHLRAGGPSIEFVEGCV